MLALTAFASPGKPAPGTYVLVKDFKITGVSKFEGGRGSAVHAAETKTKIYKVGETIVADEFFWDDDAQRWGAKIVFCSQNRSIPMEYLKLVKKPGAK
jgi:hypothetical protein